MISDKIINIDQYIAGFPTETQQCLQTIRQTIKEVLPEAKETISYGIPTFKLNGNLVHFAAYKYHIGLRLWFILKMKLVDINVQKALNNFL
ncbi:iron chaperone [Pedobacter alpinus]|uniref:Iron chaperone n=1 Tax=Pedobacter alpinus TaxID=1590643 RepID=A0ABW5TTQ4_9SPHI